MKHFLLSALTVVAWAAGVHAVERPNVVFMMTDDQAPWAIGVHAGPTHADTPHLDELFRSGAYLPNTFTPTPVCSPSRASLATSLYGSEVGIHDWINPRVEPDLGLEPNLTTWYECLHDAGYYTGIIGKWHLGLPDKFHPTHNGFDYFIGHRGGGWSPNNPTLEKDGQDKKFQGLTTDILTDHAIGFLEDRPRDQPFLLVLHFRAPHAAWLPVAPEDWAPFENLEVDLPDPNYPGIDTMTVKKKTREYLASVRGVDRNVGRLMGKLDDMNLSDNTVVIFTSDHGYNMGHNGIWHKGNGHWILMPDALPAATENIPQGQRPNMYDTSLKVPTAVRWPGVTQPGSTITTNISHLDWFPTLVSIAGGSSPASQPVRGRDLSQVLAGQTELDWDENIFSQYSTLHQSRTHMRSLRTPHWKLIRDFLNPERDELYDLQADPGEHTNVIADEKNQATIERLHRELISRMQAIQDPVLEMVEH
ncbi:sulfatase family protein [Aureliella helgolandensis]|uniref:Choline-sulfatase n=1 Tax=Aureliella helgolandensis TaxID=2527968 RepID=A0A518G9D5_9BACT|nr:sulfatase-like hydrolase/transferase [Aureliella helgolandensis]QDV25192.1 Choline-sulfatase [Aureliella helgolandensis]